MRMQLKLFVIVECLVQIVAAQDACREDDECSGVTKCLYDLTTNSLKCLNDTCGECENGRCVALTAQQHVCFCFDGYENMTAGGTYDISTCYSINECQKYDVCGLGECTDIDGGYSCNCPQDTSNAYKYSENYSEYTYCSDSSFSFEILCDANICGDLCVPRGSAQECLCDALKSRISLNTDFCYSLCIPNDKDSRYVCADGLFCSPYEGYSFGVCRAAACDLTKGEFSNLDPAEPCIETGIVGTVCPDEALCAMDQPGSHVNTCLIEDSSGNHYCHCGFGFHLQITATDEQRCTTDDAHACGSGYYSDSCHSACDTYEDCENEHLCVKKFQLAFCEADKNQSCNDVKCGSRAMCQMTDNNEATCVCNEHRTPRHFLPTDKSVSEVSGNGTISMCLKSCNNQTCDDPSEICVKGYCIDASQFTSCDDVDCPSNDCVTCFMTGQPQCGCSGLNDKVDYPGSSSKDPLLRRSGNVCYKTPCDAYYDCPGGSCVKRGNNGICEAGTHYSCNILQCGDNTFCTDDANGIGTCACAEGFAYRNKLIDTRRTYDPDVFDVVRSHIKSCYSSCKTMDDCDETELCDSGLCTKTQYSLCAHVTCGGAFQCTEDQETKLPHCVCIPPYVLEGEICLKPCETFKQCDSGFCVITGAGKFCFETPVKDCDLLSCGESAVCEIDSDQNAKCKCSPGTSLVTDPNYANSTRACFGSCQDTFNCPSPFACLNTTGGKFCMEARSCENIVCSPNTTCSRTGSSYSCACEQAYTRYGDICLKDCTTTVDCKSGTFCLKSHGVCAETVSCQFVICGENLDCSDTHGVVSCHCKNGYEYIDKKCHVKCESSHDCDNDKLICRRSMMKAHSSTYCGSRHTQCSHVVCGPNMNCDDNSGIPKCICQRGYHKLPDGRCEWNSPCLFLTPDED